jgi:6-phosphogluconolactonase
MAGFDYHLSSGQIHGKVPQAQKDWIVQVRTFSDSDQLSSIVAALWLAGLRSRPDRKIPYCVALSGGRITTNFFEEIVKQANQGGSGSIFDNVHFFWADERCVPPTDPESNYAMARELLFEPLKIPEGQIHRLRGEGPELEALGEAVGAISKVAPMSNGQPVLDMVFLGMGENGHIASLFPEESEQEMNDPAIYRAVTTIKPPPRRMTLGYGAIAAAREVRVLISGKGKEEALKQSLPPAATTPLGRVMSLRKQTTIYTDVQTGLK